MTMPLLQAPPRSAAQLDFRVASVDDAKLAAELGLRHRPDEPTDPQVLAHRWANPRTGYAAERFIVELAGRPVGFAGHMVAGPERDPQRNAEMEAFLLPGALTPARLRRVYSVVQERAAEAGAGIFNVHIHEDDEMAAGILLELGYRQDRLARAWELDLIENADRIVALASRARAAMEVQGIVCLPLSDMADEDGLEAYYLAALEAAEDMPRSGPFLPPDRDEFAAWLKSPECSPAWIFVAREGRRVVGTSTLRFPPTRGNVWTGFTGVVRDRRGRGVARAVKLAILRRAVEQHVPCVRTDNDAGNAPMLHINEELGYQAIPGYLSFRLGD